VGEAGFRARGGEYITEDSLGGGGGGGKCLLLETEVGVR